MSTMVNSVTQDVVMNEGSRKDGKNNKILKKEERKMDYNTLSELMVDSYNENTHMVPNEEPYEIMDYENAAEEIAEAFRYKHGLDYLDSLEEAETIFDEYLSGLTEEYDSFEEIVDEYDGDLSEIGEALYYIFYAVVDSDTFLLEDYIYEFDLFDRLADLGYIEFERENLSLEDAFVEFCAFHYYYKEDRSGRTIEDYLTMFNYFSEELKDTCLKDITTEDLEAFVRDDLLKRDMKFTRLRRVIGFYNQFFKYAEEYGICRHYNPMDFFDTALIVKNDCEFKLSA